MKGKLGGGENGRILEGNLFIIVIGKGSLYRYTWKVLGLEGIHSNVGRSYPRIW